MKKGIKKRKHNSKKSVLIEDKYLESMIGNGNIKKRSKSFCIAENKKNKVFKEIYKKINKGSNDKLNNTSYNLESNISSDDDSDNNEDIKGYSFSTKSYLSPLNYL